MPPEANYEDQLNEMADVIEVLSSLGHIDGIELDAIIDRYYDRRMARGNLANGKVLEVW